MFLYSKEQAFELNCKPRNKKEYAKSCLQFSSSLYISSALLQSSFLYREAGFLYWQTMLSIVCISLIFDVCCFHCVLLILGVCFLQLIWNNNENQLRTNQNFWTRSLKKAEYDSVSLVVKALKLQTFNRKDTFISSAIQLPWLKERKTFGVWWKKEQAYYRSVGSLKPLTWDRMVWIFDIDCQHGQR